MTRLNGTEKRKADKIYLMILIRKLKYSYWFSFERKQFLLLAFYEVDYLKGKFPITLKS